MMRPALVAAAALLGLIGCKPGKIDFHRVDLPGFSLELPTELVYRGDPRADYAVGAVKAERRSRPPYVVHVTWEAGPLSTPDELAAYGRLSVDAIGDPANTVAPSPVESFQVGEHPAVRMSLLLRGSPMVLVEIACGQRAVRIAAWTPRGGAVIVDRALASFRCTPVAELEAADAVADPVGFDGVDTLLRGWMKVEAEPGQLAITDGSMIALFQKTPGSAPLPVDAIDRMLPGMMKLGGAGWQARGREHKQGPHGGRDVFSGVMTADGEAYDAVVSLWPCSSNGVLAMVLHDGQGRDAALDMLLAARCPRPGDARLELPPAPVEPE